MVGISQIVVKRAQEGDAKALESLARGVEDQIHRLSMRMLADPHSAQDATQEILIRVITKLSTFEADSKFETWVYRAAYVLGEIFELDHNEAASILQISAASYRKRLSRARKSVEDFTARTCGLASPSAPCSCRKRLPAALQMGRVGNVPSHQFSDAPELAVLRKEAEALEVDLRVATLQRATGTLKPPQDFTADILRRIEPLTN